MENFILKNENAISYYLNSAINLSLTQRELNEKIKSKEYERLGEETKNKFKLRELNNKLENKLNVKERDKKLKI